MRICRQIATGRVLEMQSDATPGTLLANCQAAFPEIAQIDMEEVEITREQWNAINPVTPPPLAAIQEQRSRILKAMAEDDPDIAKIVDVLQTAELI